MEGRHLLQKRREHWNESGLLQNEEVVLTFVIQNFVDLSELGFEDLVIFGLTKGIFFKFDRKGQDSGFVRA